MQTGVGVAVVDNARRKPPGVLEAGVFAFQVAQKGFGLFRVEARMALPHQGQLLPGVCAVAHPAVEAHQLQAQGAVVRAQVHQAFQGGQSLIGAARGQGRAVQARVDCRVARLLPQQAHIQGVGLLGLALVQQGLGLGQPLAQSHGQRGGVGRAR